MNKAPFCDLCLGARFRYIPKSDGIDISSLTFVKIDCSIVAEGTHHRLPPAGWGRESIRLPKTIPRHRSVKK